MEYERILEQVITLQPSASAGERQIRWLSSDSPVGLSRTHDSRIEIFIAGPRIEPSTRTVRNSLEHQLWYRAAGHAQLEANRLLLPPVGHFDQVAAFLCIELLRNGAATDLTTAFQKTEPVIELAISRLRLGDSALLGLIGELLVLDSLLRHTRDRQNQLTVIRSWTGFRQALRDFSLGSVGVEVKTTTGAASSHLVEGTHQVEPYTSDGSADSTESTLFLVSIGIEWLMPGDGHQENVYTLPSLVDSICARIGPLITQSSSGSLMDEFLLHVKEYGGDIEVGYDHLSHSTRAAFTRPFRQRFVRCYDMSDRSVKVLRGDDIRQYPFVEQASVRFRINLPKMVSGDVNPTAGLNATSETLVNSAFGR